MFFFFYQQVDDFVEKMFQYLNIEYKKDLQVKNERIDFVLRGTNNLDILVEIKEVKNNSKDTIISAVNQLKNYREIYPKEKLNKYSFIIIFGSVEEQQKDYFKKDNIIIIDISSIMYLIRNNQDLKEQLKNILTFSIIDFVPQKIDLEKYMNYIENSKKEKSINIEDKYISEIKNIKKGKDGSKEFEKIGEKVLKYLFGDYIYGWKSQINCDNNLHRIDLLGKVKQQDGFWKMLYEIYKSRYIIFEFKNYNSKITQDQIETTNKYLSKNTLRTVAILISRDGINKNAKSICKGILRDQGQLILTLNENDLITMLQNKKENQDKDIPSEYIEKLFDEFMLGVEK